MIRRTASEILNTLEARVAHLEDGRVAAQRKTAAVERLPRPIFLRKDTATFFESGGEIEIVAPDSEISNLEGFAKINNGTAQRQPGAAGQGRNPMRCTVLSFTDKRDAEKFLEMISRPYSVIVTR